MESKGEGIRGRSVGPRGEDVHLRSTFALGPTLATVLSIAKRLNKRQPIYVSPSNRKHNDISYSLYQKAFHFFFVCIFLRLGVSGKLPVEHLPIADHLRSTLIISVSFISGHFNIL